MEWVKLILSNLTGIAAVIALAIGAVQYVRQIIKEKNWPEVVRLVSGYMEQAETMFNSGADRKEWVMALVKASPEALKYGINMSDISKLIDDLCKMSKVVNAPTPEKTVVK